MKTKKRLVLRFYKDGPRAYVGKNYWLDRYGEEGCNIAEDMGAEIPSSAYSCPGGKWIECSVDEGGEDLGGGCESALLPLEE